jgi:hypothetical protein
MDARLPGDCSNEDLLVSWNNIAAYLKFEPLLSLIPLAGILLLRAWRNRKHRA